MKTPNRKRALQALGKVLCGGTGVGVFVQTVENGFCEDPICCKRSSLECGAVQQFAYNDDRSLVVITAALLCAMACTVLYQVIHKKYVQLNII